VIFFGYPVFSRVSQARAISSHQGSAPPRAQPRQAAQFCQKKETGTCPCPATLERRTIKSYTLLASCHHTLARIGSADPANRRDARLQRSFLFSPSIPSRSGSDAKIRPPRNQRSLLIGMIAKDLVPLRPGREEPRAKKRRPKNYHLLTKPRRIMKVRGHRNRPKSRVS